MKKIKIVLIFSIMVIICVLTLTMFKTINNNLIKLNYNDLIEKIDNKETFVLCISASKCIHCNEYKPKLKKISKKYDIKLYYINIDELTDEEYEAFKIKLSFDGSTPITIFFKNGEEKTTATRIEGNIKTDKIIDKLKKNGFIKE